MSVTLFKNVPTQVLNFLVKISENFKSTYFEEHMWTNASDV